MDFCSGLIHAIVLVCFHYWLCDIRGAQNICLHALKPRRILPKDRHGASRSIWLQTSADILLLTVGSIPRSKMHRVFQLARCGSKPVFCLGFVRPTSGTAFVQGHLRHFCSSDGPDVNVLLKSLSAAMSALRCLAASYL